MVIFIYIDYRNNIFDHQLSRVGLHHAAMHSTIRNLYGKKILEETHLLFEMVTVYRPLKIKKRSNKIM